MIVNCFYQGTFARLFNVGATNDIAALLTVAVAFPSSVTERVGSVPETAVTFCFVTAPAITTYEPTATFPAAIAVTVTEGELTVVFAVAVNIPAVPATVHTFANGLPDINGVYQIISLASNVPSLALKDSARPENSHLIAPDVTALKS